MRNMNKDAVEAAYRASGGEMLRHRWHYQQQCNLAELTTNFLALSIMGLWSKIPLSLEQINAAPCLPNFLVIRVGQIST